jgi:hypothetical protein
MMPKMYYFRDWQMGAHYYLKDWQMGAHAGIDYWTHAEDFISKRRSGEIDGVSTVVPELRAYNNANSP